MISIVIPTRNAGTSFRQTLEALREQTLRAAEIVVVDSGSSDQTVDMAREFGARTIAVPAESFNHGDTRNLGVKASNGVFCVMLVQDAVPATDRWLEHLIEPFADRRVAGVTCRQIPRDDADLIGRWDVEYRARILGEDFRIQEVKDWDTFLQLSPEERLKVASFDNVASALRRDVWEKLPFRRLPFAEDLDWGVRAIQAGYQLVYNPSASVIHSHSRPALYNLRRHYISGRIVPGLLHLPLQDPGAHDDNEFFALINFLYREVHHIVSHNLLRWDSIVSFNESRPVRASLLEALKVAVARHPPKFDPLNHRIRNDFYFILEKLAGATPDRTIDASTVVRAFAVSLGAFASAYSNWCEAHRTLSPQLRLLDEWLSKGV